MAQVEFTHPLARSAKVWPAGGVDGTSKDMLVIITTLELDATHKSYKADRVAHLSNAARTWIARTDEAADFVLISRPKNWSKTGR